MSKLLEKLNRIGEGNPAPLGFGAMASRNRTSPMLLLALASSGGISSKELAAAGADAVVLKAKNATSVKAPEGDLTWGVWLDSATREEVDALKEQGCDFLVFGPEKMPVDAVSECEDVGRVLVLDADLSEERRETVYSLPVDCILAVPEKDGDSLTLTGLMDLMVIAGPSGKPALLLWNGALSKGELEALRSADVAGVLVDLSKTDVAGLKQMKEVIDSLPRRGNKKDRPAALLPRAAQAAPQWEEEEEEYEDE